MGPGRSVGIVVMVLVALGALQADVASSQRPASSRSATVTEAVYQFAARSAVAERALDDRILQLRGQIDTLKAEARTAQASAAKDVQALNGEIARLQETFVARLASLDRAYQQQIDIFRQTVVDITATPEGEAALQQYNAGDRIGALRYLDAINAAHDKAREVRTDIESAAERRLTATLANDTRSRGELDTAEVIRRFEDVTRLDPGFARDWVDLARLYADAGRLEDAQRAAQRAADIAADPRDVALSHHQLGAVLIARGDLVGARAHYEAGLAIIRKLDADSAHSAIALRDLAVGLEKLGDVLLMTAGDFAGARAHYEAALETWRRLFKDSPDSAIAKHDLSMGLVKVGDSLFVTAKPAEARVQYEAAVALAQELAGAERVVAPTGCGGSAARHLSASLSRLGNVLMFMRLIDDARRRYEASLAIDQEMVKCDVTSAAAKRDLSVSLGNVGDVLVAAGEPAEARRHYDESLAIRKQLARDNPKSAAAERDVVVSMEKLARLPGAAVKWRDVANALQDMERRGVLFPADRALLDEAQRKAATEPR